jgi:hypothetical protein
MTELSEAVSRNDTKGIKDAFRHGADVNEKTASGTTALMLAMWYDGRESAQLLISKGANVNASNQNGETALIWAAMRGYAELTHLLIDNGAVLDKKDSAGRTAQDWAVRGKHAKVEQILQEAAEQAAEQAAEEKILAVEERARHTLVAEKQRWLNEMAMSRPKPQGLS